MMSVGGRVLVVDDDPEVRLVVVTFLRTEGYMVDEADSGESALRRFAEIGGTELVIMDIDLPDNVSGITVAMALRTADPNLPVIFVSGMDHRSELASFAPPVEFFKKPFDYRELMRKVAQLMQKG